MASPVLDLTRETAAEDLIFALETEGFAILTNHGIDTAPALAASRCFFELSNDGKMRCVYRGHDSNRGYVPLGQESHSTFMTYDVKEAFHIGKEGEPGLVTPWPDALNEHFKEPLLEYWKSCNQLQLHILKLVGKGLKLEDPEYFADRCNHEHCNLRLTHFPRPEPKLVVKTRAHSLPKVYEDRATDFGTLTLIAQGCIGGLRVRVKEGKWVDVPPASDTLVLIVGEILERWTNGRLRATPHEVVSVKSAQGADKFSIYFFCNANKDVEVEPFCLDGEQPNYMPVNSLEYLTERLSVTIDTGEAFPTID
jgi:isopenicillin N synthase-like dioxygenase